MPSPASPHCADINLSLRSCAYVTIISYIRFVVNGFRLPSAKSRGRSNAVAAMLAETKTTAAAAYSKKSPLRTTVFADSSEKGRQITTARHVRKNDDAAANENAGTMAVSAYCSKMRKMRRARKVSCGFRGITAKCVNTPHAESIMRLSGNYGKTRKCAVRKKYYVAFGTLRH